MLPVGFEPTIAAFERPQTHVLDRAATGTDNNNIVTRIQLCVSVVLNYSNWIVMARKENVKNMPKSLSTRLQQLDIHSSYIGNICKYMQIYK